MEINHGIFIDQTNKIILFALGHRVDAAGFAANVKKQTLASPKSRNP